MTKRRKRSTSKGCPEPLNTMIDLAGAAAMGAFAKHKLKRDYAKGQGEESAKAAMMVYGMGSLRRGSEGLISLGGLHGISSALKDIKKGGQERGTHTPVFEDWTYKAHDNRYAWRLNCQDGREYGIDPEDYETREEYHKAIQNAKMKREKKSRDEKLEQSETGTLHVQADETGIFFCRVSLLSNGKTEYFRTTDQTLGCGDVVIVPDGDGTTEGVVISIERYSPDTCPQTWEEMREILGRGLSQGK